MGAAILQKRVGQTVVGDPLIKLPLKGRGDQKIAGGGIAVQRVVQTVMIIRIYTGPELVDERDKGIGRRSGASTLSLLSVIMPAAESGLSSHVL